MKLAKRHIETEWKDEDGYWIELKPGLKSDEDPIGTLHTIHADTKREARKAGILICDCRNCFPKKEGQMKTTVKPPTALLNIHPAPIEPKVSIIWKDSNGIAGVVIVAKSRTEPKKAALKKLGAVEFEVRELEAK